MLPAILIATIVIWGAVTIYFAVRSGRIFRERRNPALSFRRGRFGALIGTSFVQTPELSAIRSSIHFVLFFITFYFGFIWKSK
jgi:hypothetical protein